MIKYLTTALCLLVAASTYAQGNRTDTLMVLSVYNTGTCFKMEAADFGGVVASTLVGTMVMSYDTTMTLKDSGKKDTITRRAILRYKVERQCDKMSRGLNGKIVVMALNKDCDVTQTCLNVQRAGAKAFVIIHNSNSQGNIKLPKRGLYKDSIRIPIFTVRSGVGDSITTLLPTVVGIRKPTLVIRPQQLVASTDSSARLLIANKTADKVAQDADSDNDAETINGVTTPNSVRFSKRAFTLSPNPSHSQTTLTYQFSQPTDVTLYIENVVGQVMQRQILRGITVGSVDISTSEWASGTYILSMQYGKEIKTKKFEVQH